MTSRFNSAHDFRQSLEMRLKRIAKEKNLDLQRIRRQLAFDRLLARVFMLYPDRFFLKGGYAMELVFSQARSTRDIDLVIRQNMKEDFDPIQFYQLLREISELRLEDFFTFIISTPLKNLDNPTYGGTRFLIDALIDQRRFVNFRMDIVSDIFFDDLKLCKTNDWLQFKETEPSSIYIISLEQQFAEKLHAYTLPPIETNSRVKDMIDLVLISSSEKLNPVSASHHLKRIFALRKTH